MRAVISDDHAGFRAAARAMLTEAAIDVVGEAADAESSLLVFEAASPDRVLLERQLPGTDGFAVSHVLGRQQQPPLVGPVTARHESSDTRRAEAAPLIGLLLTEELTSCTLEALLRQARSP